MKEKENMKMKELMTEEQDENDKVDEEMRRMGKRISV